MLGFLQDFIPSWSSTTATRLVDACEAHLSRKTEELKNAQMIVEHCQQNSEQADANSTACVAKLNESKQELKSCVSSQETRLRALAKAIMSVDNTTDEDNVETVRQVLEMASASCSETFTKGVCEAREHIADAEQQLERAETEASTARCALRTALDGENTVKQQIREIETIRNRLQTPATEDHEKVN